MPSGNNVAKFNANATPLRQKRNSKRERSFLEAKHMQQAVICFSKQCLNFPL
jgi:hypothetical protein